LIRGHRAGVKTAPPWSRNAHFGEDYSRRRHVNALANLMPLRIAVLRLFASFAPASSIPHRIVALPSRHSRCLALASKPNR
jgi:hypothetical protein